MWNDPSNVWVNHKDGLTEETFSKLLEEYYPILFNFGVTFCDDKDLLKDTLQDLFLSIWENRTRLEIEDTKNYLLKSLRNNLYRNMRSQKNVSVDDGGSLDFFGYESSIEKIIITNETAFQCTLQLEALIAKLSDKQREVVFLKYYQGLSNEEIAHILSVNKQSVANSVHRIITILREKLPAYFAALFLSTQLFDFDTHLF
jgi:RNA polymerase sigma-70 factor (ECF subfamily)